MHPDELLSELTPLEFAEWQAFDRLEPLGTEWLAQALVQLMQLQLSSETDATFDDLMEGLGFRPYEAPVDERAADAAQVAQWGAI